MSDMEDSITDFLKGLIKGRRLPLTGIFFSGLVSGFVMLCYIWFGADPHMKKMRENFESGNFQGAIAEAEARLAEEPTEGEAWIMLGDSHAALAEMPGTDFNKHMYHVCEAIKAYQKRLDLGYISPVASKMEMLKQRTQDMVTPEGIPYGGCDGPGLRQGGQSAEEPGETEESPEGFGEEGSGEP